MNTPLKTSFVNGAFVDAPNTPDILENRNPSRPSEIVDRFARADAALTQTALQAAKAASGEWGASSAQVRADVLDCIGTEILARREELGRLLAREEGKILREAVGEVDRAGRVFKFYAQEALRAHGEKYPPVRAGVDVDVITQPVGVVGIISPWNFPIAIPAWKIAPALCFGNTVVFKPAELVPSSAWALAEIISLSGLPAGAFNLLIGPGRSVGDTILRSPLVDAVSFTGSTDVGRQLMAECAKDIKKVSLELGGNAPFIVFDDADLDAAVEGALISKYRNNGQTCVCANRLYVQDSVYDAFVDKLKAAVARLKIGNGLDDGITTGPLIDAKAVAKVQEHIEDAKAKGAKVVTGGNPHALGGTFFEPTILVDVPKNALVAKDETFGPLAPLFRFKDEAEVIQMANDTEFGLASYFYAKDLSRVFRVAEALEYGMVGINTGLISNELAPFGGVKASGLGREGSKYGIEDYVEIKYLCLSI